MSAPGSAGTTRTAGRSGRVLMLGPLPPPVGGMATVVENLVVGLRGRVAVRVLNTVKTTPADRSLWQGVVAQLRLLWRLADLCVRWQPDLVHIHTCSRFSFWRSGVDVLLARMLGRRVVVHIHGAQFHHFLAGLGAIPAWAARRVFALCASVVVLGTGWKRVLDAWTTPARVAVVPNGVPVPPARSSPPPAGFRILCLANYERRKGQEDLLRAVAGLRERATVSVELLGFESEAGEARRLRALADALGLGTAVQIPGPVVGADKVGRIEAAHCFCLPSSDEGLPMAMLEAMAAGLPVVVTRVGAIPEAIGDGVDGLLYDAGDVDALRAHLQALLDAPDSAHRLGAAGRARVQRDFSLAASVERLLAVYATSGVPVRSVPTKPA